MQEISSELEKNTNLYTARNLEFSIKVFFNKWDQICSFLHFCAGIKQFNICFSIVIFSLFPINMKFYSNFAFESVSGHQKDFKIIIIQKAFFPNLTFSPYRYCWPYFLFCFFFFSLEDFQVFLDAIFAEADQFDISKEEILEKSQSGFSRVVFLEAF